MPHWAILAFEFRAEKNEQKSVILVLVSFQKWFGLIQTDKVLPKLTVSTIENRQLSTPASYYRPKISRPRRRRQPRREVIASTDKSGVFLEPHLTTHKRLVWCPSQATKGSVEPRCVIHTQLQ